MKRLAVVAFIVAAGLGPIGPARAEPQGQITYAMHVTIAAAWFDPAENTGIATPFMVQEALHDSQRLRCGFGNVVSRHRSTPSSASVVSRKVTARMRSGFRQPSE